MKYVVKTGETFYSIAKKFGITHYSLVISNPNIVSGTIHNGQTIDVPILEQDAVLTNISYTYEVLTNNLNMLKENYPFLKVELIGKSVLGKNIYAISIGRGKNEVSYNSAHHAHEWITTPMLMKFVEQFAKHLVKGIPFYGFNPMEIYDNATIRIVPMVNPDGVNLQIKGLTDENKLFHDKLMKWNNGSTDFTYWTANIRGVDINHNYEAAWYSYKQREPLYGITGPGPKRYSGPNPVSEPETEAMVNFTRSHKFRLVIAYHTQGQVIYWDFMNKAPKEALTVAEKFKEVSGYELEGIAEGSASSGGYKDWFIEEFKRPGFTIEAGLGENPLPLTQFDEIYRRNVKILLLAPLV